MPFFQNPETRRFDRSMMMNFLRTIQEEIFPCILRAQEQIKQMKNYWLFWENNLKYVRLDEKMANIITKAVGANAWTLKMSLKPAVVRSILNMPLNLLPVFPIQVSSFSQRTQSSLRRTKGALQTGTLPLCCLLVVDILPSQQDNEAIKARIETGPGIYNS